MRNKLASFLKKDINIFLLFVLIDIIFFWKYFFYGLIPIPADVIIGGYFPWLNEKWGYEVGVPVKNALMSDVVSLLYPWRLLAIDLFKSGQIPFWDSTSFLGTSLIGNFQAGIFNPFNLLFLLPRSFNTIWGLQVVIQPLLAMFCMYLMLRNWRITRGSSIFGAMSYAFSAQILVWIEYNTLSFALAVFPIFILVLDKFLETRRAYHLAGISLIIAYVIFVGYPQHLYYFTLFGLIYVLFLSHRKNGYSGLLKNGFLLMLFIGWGLVLGAVSLFPGLEALSFSIKSLDTSATQNSVLFLPWQNLLTAFIPDFFGNPATNNYFGVGYYESFIFYTSITVIPFALMAVQKNIKDNRVIISLLFLGLAFLLALHTPLSQLLQNLTFVGLKGSVSSRVLFIYSFSISALAAIGVEQFRKTGVARTKFYLKHLPLIVIFGVVTGVLISLGFVKLIIGNFELIHQDYLKIIISLRNIVIPFFLALTVSVLIFVSRFSRIRPVLIFLIIGLMFLDYFKFSSKYLPFTRKDLVFPVTPSLSFLKNQSEPFRIAIEKAELMPANTWSVYGLESISGYNILLPKDTADYITYLNSSQISRGYSRVLDINNLNSPFLDIANVKYLITLFRKDGSPSADGGPLYNMDQQKYNLVFKEGAAAIYENRDYLERFVAVSKTVSAEDINETYRLINYGNFDYKNGAVLKRETQNREFQKCSINKVDYRSQNISLKVNCPGESFLFFSQIFYPGWKAKINDQPVKIQKANGIFSGINLHKGHSEISIYFFPDSFKIGLLISFASLLGYFGFLLHSGRKNI